MSEMADEIQKLKARLSQLEADLELERWAHQKDRRGFSHLYAELQTRSEVMEKHALLDPVTGLLNRRGLQAALDREIAWIRRYGSELVALLIDLDDFKRINESHGHTGGDELLRSLGARLRSALRTTDYVSRVGGDEFVVLLPQIRPAEAAVVAEKLLLAISEKVPIAGSLESVRVTASLGGILIDESARTVDDVLAKGYLLLRQGKDGGKNRAALGWMGGVTGDIQSAGKSSSSARLDQASAYYALAQPIFDLKNRRPVGFELLSRSLIQHFEIPADFFRLASESNALALIDQHCFRACLKASERLPQGAVCHINLFPSTLEQMPVDWIAEACSAADPGRIYCIELSERQMVGNPADLCEKTRRIKKHGLRLALDDIGFGRSSLESIVLLEPDYIKIDKQWTLGIAREPSRALSLKKLQQIASALGILMVAEGVEQEEDLEFITRLAVPLGQGFLLGKPQSIA